jgi:hypothetical protein
MKFAEITSVRGASFAMRASSHHTCSMPRRKSLRGQLFLAARDPGIPEADEKCPDTFAKRVVSRRRVHRATYLWARCSSVAWVSKYQPTRP